MRGTLDLMILQMLDLQAMHGIAIADRIRQVTQGAFEVKPGSLFPALHRLEEDGAISGEWTVTDDGRRIRAYALTASGRKRLTADRRQWDRIVAAMSQVLGAS
jgi:transcriptional regulator